MVKKSATENIFAFLLSMSMLRRGPVCLSPEEEDPLRLLSMSMLRRGQRKCQVWVILEKQENHRSHQIWTKSRLVLLLRVKKRPGPSMIAVGTHRIFTVLVLPLITPARVSQAASQLTQYTAFLQQQLTQRNLKKDREFQGFWERTKWQEEFLFGPELQFVRCLDWGWCSFQLDWSPSSLWMEVSQDWDTMVTTEQEYSQKSTPIWLEFTILTIKFSRLLF